MRHRLPLLLASLLTAAACGTGVYTHRIEVTVRDPSGRLGPPPLEVSVFNKTSGYSEDWARRFMGTTGPGALYTGEVGATDTKMMFDRSLPAGVVAGLSLPAYEQTGYFVLDVKPQPGEELATTLAFAPYNSYFPVEGGAVAALPATVRSTAEKQGWLLHLAIDVPPPPAGVTQATAAD